MLAPFAFTTGSLAFVGVLEPMADSLGITVATAGQLQTAFAVATAVGGPVLAASTRALPKKPLLVAVLVVLAAAHALCAVTYDFRGLVGLRVAAGFVGSLSLPLATAIAVASVAPHDRPRAIATVFAGVTLAFLVGVPSGSVVGDTLDWHASFWLASVVSATAAVAIALVVPRAEPVPAARAPLAMVLRWPLIGYLALTFLSFCATFTTVAYIGPVVMRLTGFGGSAVGAVQVCVGLGGIVGLVLGARLAQRRGPVLAMLLAGTILAQAIFSAGMLFSGSPWTGAMLVVAASLFGSTALFSMNPIIQMRLADGAGPAATLAFALNGSMVFLGQGAGAALGGLVTSGAGLAFVGVVGAAVAILAALLSLPVTRAPLGPAR